MMRSSRHDFNDAQAAADFLRARISAPELALIAGTGLGQITASAVVDTTVDYNEIPHFPAPTVQSHLGRLAVVTFQDRPLLVLLGRFHLYEGRSARQVTFPVRVLQALGVRILILTNASGGLNPRFKAGDIMVIQDHINLTGDNPLAGANDDRWGPRFPQMVQAYSGRLQGLALGGSGAPESGVRRGIYAGLKGPSLETPAEMRYLRTIGADAVGFSTVMETIAAVHAGMQVLGLSVITNMCLPDAAAPAEVQEIIAVAQSAVPRLEAILGRVIRGWDQEND
jgi:purine-nucleoside phosphorylase